MIHHPRVRRHPSRWLLLVFLLSLSSPTLVLAEGTVEGKPTSTQEQVIPTEDDDLGFAERVRLVLARLLSLGASRG